MTIPASSIVSVIPSVISAGGSALNLSGLLLSVTSRTPIGSVLSFPSAAAVSSYYGPTSPEAAIAAIYFAGYQGATALPGAMLIAQYNQSAVAAYLRGGSVAALTLAQLQAISGTLSIVMDGVARTVASVVLTGATSFSSAAALLQTALTATEPTEATCTSGTISGTVLTVSGTITGVFAVGQTITGTSVTAGSVITSLGTGTGGAGTYNLSASSTVGSGETSTAVTTAVTCTYDSVSGGFVVTSGITGVASTAAVATGTAAAGLMLTTATGAVTSQGAAIAVPATLMNSIIAQTDNWASFMTTIDPDGGSGNTLKQAFAAWVNTTQNNYVYVAWDTDITPTLSTAATASLGYLLGQSASSGTIPIYSVDYTIAAFVCGAIASINFNAINGRSTFSFKSAAGLVATCTGPTAQANLLANGYNFYGSYATANQGFVFFYNGSISGKYKWADSYINQIWLNNAFQLDMMGLLVAVGSIPYNNAGYALVRASLMSTILQAVNFGMIRVGVPLSSSQVAEVNNAAGVPIDAILSQQGWYLQILPASAASRAARTTPPMNFWYMDGGSIQSFSLSSIEVQ